MRESTIRKKRVFVLLAVITALFMIVTSSFATPSASLMFTETDLGGGLWDYDYTINNTSDNGEQLYMFLLDFGQAVTVEGSALPTAWFGTVWQGTNVTSYLDAMSINPVTYLNAGDSLGGFSFTTVNSRAGDLPFHAEFLGVTSADGTTTPVAPEPVSTVLFLVGGVTMAFRYRQTRKRQLS